MFDINKLFEYKKYSENDIKIFDGFNVKDVLAKKQDNLVILKIENDNIIPFNYLNDLKEYLTTLGLTNVKLYFKVKNQDISIKDFKTYLEHYSKEHNNHFNEDVVIKEDDHFVLSYVNMKSLENDLEYLDDLKLYFYDIGYRKDIILNRKEVEVIPPKTVDPIVQETGVKVEDKPQSKPNYYAKKKEYKEVVIDDLVDTMYQVKFTGEIFKVEEKTTKTNSIIQTIYVKDATNAVIVKVIEGRRFNKNDLKKNTEGTLCTFIGNYRFDTFNNDYLFEPDQIEYLEKPKALFDDAENKRVELHAHTKYSEMDGVCSPEQIVNAAYDLGHEAVAITDHLCLQGFHAAQGAYKKIKKAHPEDSFKVIYGCEMNVVEPNLNIVYNVTDDTILDSTYVVFDLETTGLSTRHDYIIEFGAIKMFKGNELERKDFFVKPPIEIPTIIKEKTNIKDTDVQNARTFTECKDEILEFIKDSVLVAHNASFDFGFLNEELKRIGEKPLTNTVIDTLDLSRSLFKTRRAYRLGNMARQYGVEYDEESAHRADYDARVLADVFHLMMKDCEKAGVHTLKELANFQGDDAFVKNRAYHATVLAKNEEGVHDLYKLVSISNTDTLAIFGKANTKALDSEFVAEPRIFKSAINKYRKNILVGSSCLNGEVFEFASTRSNEELAKAISFFDYIEIQPLENYRFLYEDRELFSKERLKEYLKDIIAEAKRQNKIIVATGDVHYVTEDQKIYRDVFINAQAIGGVHHPLYIYDKEKRSKQITPSQRFLNTKEMLEAFSWLNDDNLVNEIVIDNTKKIAGMCEEYKPFNDTLYPPRIDNAILKARDCNIFEEPFNKRNDVISADDYLKELVYYNAHKLYGDKLDEVIEKRIDRELKAIIGNGYGVIYYTCHLMCKRSNNDGYVVGSRGSVGSSLVATLSGITEVNPLKPHYICPKCHRLEWVDNVASGYDLFDKTCPDCGTPLKGEGQNIPFETFMGFHGEKIPDIDLNFSGEYQGKAHLFTREIFGENNVFRAGTISTVADKTAFGYVSGYCEEKGITNMSRAQKERLVQGCVDVKRTTGQHAGGIVVLPDDMKIEDITPIQYPANDSSATWRSTHFEYHDFSDNLLKFDILGHVDPTAMKLFSDISGIDITTIPMNDPKALSLFNSPKALNIINPKYKEETGACGLPEFGTRITRRTLELTRPKVFSELVQISGLSHGTDVWAGNAEELIKSGLPLKDVIGCRDDIMSTLMSYGLESADAFKIMEFVRKNKAGAELPPDFEKLMTEHNVPAWYINSCRKIKYMFPKAHAVAYCIMAVRVAWFKVYHPEYYYVHYLTLRCDAYELETMIKDADSIYNRMNEILVKFNSRENPASKKEKDVFNTLEVCYEMVSRGYRLTNIDLNKSLATEFLVNPDNKKEIIPPFIVIDGLGVNVAESIVEARSQREFMSKEDLCNRTLLSTTLTKKLESIGVLKNLDDSNQISLF